MGQAYNAASGAFSNAILRTLFGFQPPLPFGPGANSSSGVLFEPMMGRRFNGDVKHVHWRGKEWSINSSSDIGLSIRAEAALGD